MDQSTPAPPPALADEALGAVMQLAQAASRHEGELGDTERGGDGLRGGAGAHGKGRGRGEMQESGRAPKQMRVEGEQHGGVEDPALSWASTAPPAYSGPHDAHGAPQDQNASFGNAMQFAHGEAPFHGYPEGGVGVPEDASRGGMGPAHQGSDAKHLTSEATGLVGARGKTGMTRTLSTSRRAEQNRNAQRVFRERKNKYIADLESKAASLESALLAAEEHRRRFNDALDTIEILKRDNDTLRVALRALGGHQAVPSAPPLPLERAQHAPSLLPQSFQPGAQGGAVRGPHHGGGEQGEGGEGGQGAGGAHGLPEGTDSNQDPATAAAVAVADGAPYWLLEAVSNNQGHGFQVPPHFPSQLGEHMGGGSGAGEQGAQQQQQGGDQSLRGRGDLPGPQRGPEGMIDPSLDEGRVPEGGGGGASGEQGEGRGQRTEDSNAQNKDARESNSGDGSGNPDNLASLSAVAAAAAAANSQKQ